MPQGFAPSSPNSCNPASPRQLLCPDAVRGVLVGSMMSVSAWQHRSIRLGHPALPFAIVSPGFGKCGAGSALLLQKLLCPGGGWNPNASQRSTSLL